MLCYIHYNYVYSGNLIIAFNYQILMQIYHSYTCIHTFHNYITTNYFACLFRIPSCILLKCLDKWLALLNVFEQWEHWYGRSPVWINICLFKFPQIENALVQILHRYGLIPVCTLLWTSKALFFENILWHSSQIKFCLSKCNKNITWSNFLYVYFYGPRIIVCCHGLIIARAFTYMFYTSYTP